MRYVRSRTSVSAAASVPDEAASGDAVTRGCSLSGETVPGATGPVRG